MPKKLSKIFVFLTWVLIVLFINGSPDLSLPVPIHQSKALNCQSVSKGKASANRPEIRELKIKIRYMGSECNYLVAQEPEINISSEIREERKFLNYVSIVAIHFPDSFRSRGPPSIA